MRKKILNHTCILVVVSVLLTFLAAGLVMYGKYNEDLKESVRDSLKYVQDGVEKMGNSYLDDALGKATSARITLLDPKGNVLFDSLENSAELENHSNRPEFIQAEKNGYAESLRYSETLSKQNFYFVSDFYIGGCLGRFSVYHNTSCITGFIGDRSSLDQA